MHKSGRSNYPSTPGHPATGLERGYARAREEGGGIVPGAHPEFEKGTEIGNPIKQIGGAIKAITQRLNKTGSAKSPSTRSDK